MPFKDYSTNFAFSNQAKQDLKAALPLLSAYFSNLLQLEQHVLFM